MKQYSFKHMFILCSAVFFSSNLSAQLIARSEKTASPSTGNYTEAVMNPKIQNALSKNFKDAAALTWFNKDKNTIVRFTQGKILHRILFAPNGKQIYHISYAEAADLPLAVVRAAKNFDAGFTIERGIYVEQANEKVWIVYAQKKEQLFAVRIEEDEVEVFDVSDGKFHFNSSFSL